MASGGYTPTLKTKNEIPYCKAVPQVDLRKLEKDVKEALKYEKSN